MSLEQAIKDLRSAGVLMAQAERCPAREPASPGGGHRAQDVLENPLQRIERNLEEIRVKFERLMRRRASSEPDRPHWH